MCLSIGVGAREGESGMGERESGEREGDRVQGKRQGALPVRVCVSGYPGSILTLELSTCWQPTVAEAQLGPLPCVT